MKKNFKKIFLLVALVVTAMACFAFSASALSASGKIGDNVKYTYNSSTKQLVVSGSGDMYNYDNNSPFYNNMEITTVVINKGVTGIGNNIFYNCRQIKKVTIADTVKYVGSSAFNFCVSLESVTIPDSVTVIRDDAFSGCVGLKNIKVGNGVTVIGGHSFYACDALETVELGNSVRVINNYAFWNCYSLRKISIPISIKEIASAAFKECYSLSDIYYGGSASDWNKISISSYGNECLTSATRHYNYFQLGKTSKLTATQNTSAIKLTWNSVAGADRYQVYKIAKGNWVSLGTTTALSKTVSGLLAGTKYSFAVVAGKNVNGTVKWADTYTTINTATKTVKPLNIKATQSTTAIKLTWSKCSGATGYRIYVKSGSKWEVIVSTTSGTSYTFSPVDTGRKCTFAIRPYIKHGNTVVWSDYTEFTAATNPAKVTAKATSSTKGKIALSWNLVDGADGYQVYYKTGNGSYKLYKTVGKNVKSLSFSNLKSGTKYTFAVRAGIKTSGGNIYGAYKTAAVTVK